MLIYHLSDGANGIFDEPLTQIFIPEYITVWPYNGPTYDADWISIVVNGETLLLGFAEKNANIEISGKTDSMLIELTELTSNMNVSAEIINMTLEVN